MVVVRKLKFKRFARRNGHEAEKFVMDFSEQNAHVPADLGNQTVRSQASRASTVGTVKPWSIAVVTTLPILRPQPSDVGFP